MIEEQPDEYSYILVNSFVVIYKLMDISINIDLVDLVAEKAYKFSYTIYDYLKGLLDVVNDEVEKNELLTCFHQDISKTLKLNAQHCFGILKI